MLVSVILLICRAASPVVLIHSVNFNSLPVSPLHLSIALLTSSDFGKPLFPVGKAIPSRQATKQPVGTFRHQTLPV